MSAQTAKPRKQVGKGHPSTKPSIKNTPKNKQSVKKGGMKKTLPSQAPVVENKTTEKTESQTPATTEKAEKEKTTRKSKKLSPSFKTYIHKVLKQVSPESSIRNDAIGQLDEYVKILAGKLSQSSRNSCRQAGKSTVGKTEVVLAVRLHLPGELAKHAVAEIEKACAKFNSEKPETTSRSVRREAQAGLTFSVALSEKFIRNFNESNLNVSKNSSVALAAVLEYITAEIMELSANVSRDNKLKIIRVRDIFLAIEADSELSSLTHLLGVEFINCGVVPGINPALEPTKEKKMEQAARRRKNAKNRVGKTEGKKPHKKLPGTKALLDIKHHQRGFKLLLQKLPFERDVREIAKTINETYALGLKDIHFGNGAMEIIQNFVEARVIKLCQTSILISVHYDNIGVKGKDVKLAWKLTEPMIPYQSTHSVSEVGGNGIGRLGYRAGVKRKSQEMYVELRFYMYALIYAVLFQALHIVRHSDVITVGVKHLRYAFFGMGFNVTVPSLKPKTRPNKSVSGKQSV